MSARLAAFARLMAWLAHASLGAQFAYRVNRTPEAIKAVWHCNLPKMSATGRCSAAFDGSADRKMALQCASISPWRPKGSAVPCVCARQAAEVGHSGPLPGG